MDKHFDYCILKKHNGTTYVTLFNNNHTVTHYLLTETAIRDVNVDIDNNGILYITGKEDIYEVALHERIKVDELDSRPEEKFIHKYKGFKLFGRWIIKPYEYVINWYGWYGKKNAKYILKNYNIEILD
jgi:hypothetical protein